MSNKALYWVVGVIAAAAIVGGVVYKSRDRQKEPMTETTNTPASEEEQSTTGTQSGGVTRSPRAEAGLSYQQVVDKYLNYRVQFNAQCQATPSSMTFKTGTRIMFDNRSEQTRKITIDGHAYTVGPNGFIVLTLASASLPHTVKIDCDAQYNVANLLIQK